jgi:hypothetical protein
MRTPDAERRTHALVEALHPDGLDGGELTWIEAPPFRRRRMRAKVIRQGLVVESSWLATPRAAPRLLLPLVPVSGAVRRSLACGADAGRLLRLAARLDGRLLEELAPGVGLLVQRPGARRPLAWLAEAGAEPPAAVSAGWHEPADGLVLAGTRTMVKSTVPGAARDPLQEAALLRELGPGARRAGARVPQVLYAGSAGERVALVEDVLAGERAAEVLRRHPSRLDSLASRLADWLDRWHRETRETRPFTDADLERLVLAPARALAAKLPAGYVERLEELGRSLEGSDVSFAAAHNDLTTWNVLVDGDAVGIVDWEAAEHEALPLVDLDYLIVDAVAAARRLERVAAFERCSGDGPDGRLARRLRDEHRLQLDLDADVAELARHSCWLGHARNEARRAGPGSPRPFLAVLASLAAS